MAQSGWYADPVGRHERRFFNGLIWTSDVLDGEEHGVDPVDASAPVPQLAGSGNAVTGGAVPSIGWHPPPAQAWRDGDELVIRAGAPLPPICVFCGQPAVAGIRTGINARGHSIASLQLIGLRIPVCEDDRRRNRAVWMGALVNLVVVIVVVALTGRLPGLPGLLGNSFVPVGVQAPTVRVLVIALVTFVGIRVVRRLVRGSSGPPRPLRLRVVRSRGGFIWLRNADERCLSQLTALAPGP
jgi:hypothetical protein